MIGSRPFDFPMEQHLRLRPKDGTLLPDPIIYRQLVGRLLYLTVTKPNIQYVVNTLSQFMQFPYSTHLDATEGLFLSTSSSLTFVGFAYSD